MNDSDASFAIKRIYDEPADDDGCRVLVDRLWPRGVRKERAQLQLWPRQEMSRTFPLGWCHD